MLDRIRALLLPRKIRDFPHEGIKACRTINARREIGVNWLQVAMRMRLKFERHSLIVESFGKNIIRREIK